MSMGSSEKRCSAETPFSEGSVSAEKKQGQARQGTTLNNFGPKDITLLQRPNSSYQIRPIQDDSLVRQLGPYLNIS